MSGPLVQVLIWFKVDANTKYEYEHGHAGDASRNDEHRSSGKQFLRFPSFLSLPFLRLISVVLIKRIRHTLYHQPKPTHYRPNALSICNSTLKLSLSPSMMTSFLRILTRPHNYIFGSIVVNPYDG